MPNRKDPNFQLFREQARRYLEKGQPKLAEQLRKSGELEKVLDQRAEQAQLVLQQCQKRKLDPAGTDELVMQALMPGAGEE